MEKIKINFLLPWFLAAGFALLFFSTLLVQKSPQVPPQQSQPTASRVETSPTTQQNSSAETQKDTLVKRVIDGDTTELVDGTRVRYIGIDTPESGQCAGEAAMKENVQFAENKKVILETDVQKYDKYGRTLAYVFVDGVFINEELLKRGLATVTTYPPNIKYVDRFLRAQQEAREKRLGLWSEAPCPTPSVSPTPEISTQPPTLECTIKGNISSSGEKIYHLPGQRYFEKTKIEENKGERWFCTEEEAQKAGWRKSKV